MMAALGLTACIAIAVDLVLSLRYSFAFIDHHNSSKLMRNKHGYV